MNKKETLKTIRNSIALNKTDVAVSLLKQIITDNDLQDEITFLEARINNNTESEGTVIGSIIQVERNNITKSLLRIVRKVDDLKDSNTEKPEKEVFEEILHHLEMTTNTYKIQRKLRKKLHDQLTTRKQDLSFDNKYHMMSKYYSILNIEEQRIHRTIRGFTEDIIKKHNYEVLNILQNNINLKSKISKLNTLELHLTIWKSKYESTFHNDETINWIYAGIDEGVGFPNKVVDEIRNILN